jgi:uncharacterized lipoprotein YmbA
MRSVACVSVLLLIACAGAGPLRTRYLLRADVSERAGRLDAPVRIGLGRVAVAPYLDQDGIVVETEAGQVRAARQHQWAEPLSAGLRSLLRAEISDVLGYEISARPGDRLAWDFTVDVYVDRLHGSMEGTAVIDAGYWITPRVGGEAVEYRFSQSAPLPREGYPGLVDAEVVLARRLAEAIAGALETRTGRP